MRARARAGRPTRRRTPVLVVALCAVSIVFLAVPLVALFVRASWSTMWQDVSSPQALVAIRLSLVCSLSATGLCLVLGVPLAWVLARTQFPGRRLLRALALLPLVLPPVVAGVALLTAFGRTNGIVGRPLYEWFGLQFTFTTVGAVLAETFVALPFLVLTVEAAFRTVDERYEEVAASLGAGTGTTFRRVTLPMIGPGLLAGATLAWARALGEFGATITFAGNIQGRTETVPLAVYVALEGHESVAIALSLALLFISVVLLVSLRGQWLRGFS
jgi:molybdate transport system permease protein